MGKSAKQGLGGELAVTELSVYSLPHAGHVPLGEQEWLPQNKTPAVLRGVGDIRDISRGERVASGISYYWKTDHLLK